MKRFFNEKEVTSTLVMDALVSGVKQIEEYSRLTESKKVLHRLMQPSSTPQALHSSSLGSPCRGSSYFLSSSIKHLASCMPEATHWAYAVQSHSQTMPLRSAGNPNCKPQP